MHIYNIALRYTCIYGEEWYGGIWYGGIWYGGIGYGMAWRDWDGAHKRIGWMNALAGHEKRKEIYHGVA